jgi:hypothetical protein
MELARLRLFGLVAVIRQQVVSQAGKHLVRRRLLLRGGVVLHHRLGRHVEGDRRPLGVNILLGAPPPTQRVIDC